MFSFFKRKKAPAPQEAVPVQDSTPDGVAESAAPEVAPVAPTELPAAWAAGMDESAAPDSRGTPAETVEPVQPPDAWADRPDEPSDPLARLDRSASEPSTQSGSAGSWLGRLRRGLSRTGQNLGGLFSGVKVDEALFEELETALIMADAGIEATEKLLTELRVRVKRQRLEQPEAVRAALRDILSEHLAILEKPFVVGETAPMVVMIAGVNGAGKTTSIGKLARALRERQASVLLAAGDTFRAAAREQLVAWGARNDVTVIAQEGGDPAAVAFDAVNAGRARSADVVLVDTAGRLPTQTHLMEELKKIKRVIGKADPGAPHEILLVVDGNTGQNVLAQIRAFDAALGLTGLIVTKLDGTAKGGTLAAVAAGSQGVRPVPVYWIGVGEGMQDLQPFVAAEFADALLGGPEAAKG
ncbi:MAG: signal recognition particle-docking protein FtsY [Castellaniella sp.]|uniref:signal recognition particle-docking protein FtsY n=1 Tax=Castellaniella sp. TaxID=1955812 RepID=UPI002A359ECB|nr:signal recognition particle-docking protein FtsY [Castellaniella sp.]MDY0308669.1 signal recognition particle-docking protein FtsY [Castellaniella sp.]